MGRPGKASVTLLVEFAGEPPIQLSFDSAVRELIHALTCCRLAQIPARQ